MIDYKKCNGCKNCSIACMQSHRLNKGNLYNLELTDNANESRNFIKADTNGYYYPLFCRHCDDPECVSTCMSGAMTKNTDNGLVLYDKEQCASCFMCIMTCPFGILKPDTKTKTFVIKCDFCIQNEKGPHCVNACPTKAICIEEV